MERPKITTKRNISKSAIFHQCFLIVYLSIFLDIVIFYHHFSFVKKCLPESLGKTHNQWICSKMQQFNRRVSSSKTDDAFSCVLWTFLLFLSSYFLLLFLSVQVPHNITSSGVVPASNFLHSSLRYCQSDIKPVCLTQKLLSLSLPRPV